MQQVSDFVSSDMSFNKYIIKPTNLSRSDVSNLDLSSRLSLDVLTCYEQKQNQCVKSI